ncbi:unnamed protein product [Pedinophyceae sp. YPF-701]|nr:unnamed protein product [Pedinophyceae sp. YPF-701]
MSGDPQQVTSGVSKDEEQYWKDYSAGFRRRAANKASREGEDQCHPVPDNRRPGPKVKSAYDLLTTSNSQREMRLAEQQKPKQ